MSLAQVGRDFRKMREGRSLSLQDIENATSIRQPYLQAIEDGTIDQLISPVYARGFLKQYAHFLGLDVEAICSDLSDSPEFGYGNGLIGTADHRGGYIRRHRFLLWSGLAFVVVALAYYVMT